MPEIPGPDDYRAIANADDLPAGRCVAIGQGGIEVALCRVAKNVHAFENHCSHMGLSLAGGRVMGGKLFCPHHGAAFDLTDGRALGFPASQPIRIIASRVRDGIVEVATGR